MLTTEKTVNFPGGTSEKILEKLDDIIKEKLDDLIVHVGTNDITNNVNLLTNVEKIFKKFLKITIDVFGIFIYH